MAPSSPTIAELPTSDLTSPYYLSPPVVSPQSQSSGHTYSGQSSSQERTQDFECRLQALEKAFQEHQEVCPSRRYKNALMRALAKLLIPGSGSSGSSQKTQSYSQISLGTQSESDRGQYIKSWAISQVSLGQYDNLKGQSQHHPSSDRSLVKTFGDSILQSSSLTELMDNEKILPVEMMDSSPVEMASPVEIMSAERKRMSELRFAAGPGMTPPKRTMHALPSFPTTPVVATAGSSDRIGSTPVVSPTGDSATMDSFITGSSKISSATTFTPVSSLSTGSPLDGSFRYAASRARRRSTKNSLGFTAFQSPAARTPVTFTGDLSLGATQPFEFMMASSDTPTAQFAPYFLGQFSQSHESTVPESPMEVHATFTCTNGGWQGEESPVIPNAAYFDSGETHWHSASAGNNLYVVSAPHHTEIPTVHPFPSTISDVCGEVTTQTSIDADGPAVGQLAGEPSLFGCHPCGFYPDPGPDQRKKLAKHKKTDKHCEITGEGDVETFYCSHPGCEATYNRRDNLVQHEKSHVNGFQDEMVKVGHELESSPLPSGRPAKRRRQSSIAMRSGKR